MAVNASALETYDNPLRKEDVSDVLERISPTETPFYTAIGRGTCNNTLIEWPVHELAAQDLDNAVVEGEDNPTLNDPAVAGRAQNYTQISQKVVKVSDTMEAVSDYGRLGNMAKQMSTKMLELKRDMEGILLNNKAASSGASNTARITAGMMAWIKTNTSSNGGSDPTVSGSGDFNGYPDAAAGAGTVRAFTETLANSIVLSCFNEGGKPSMMLMNPANKQVVSANFTGNSTRYKNAEDKRIVASVDLWVSDFGELQAVPDRFLPTLATSPATNYAVLFVDPDYAEVCFLYNVRQKTLARTGHSETRMLQTEYALKVGNEKAHGIIRDTSGAAS